MYIVLAVLIIIIFCITATAVIKIMQFMIDNNFSFVSYMIVSISVVITEVVLMVYIAIELSKIVEHIN